MQFWISTLCNRVDCDLISLSTNTGVNSFAIVNCSIAPLCKKSIVIQFHWGLIKGLGGLPSFYLSSKSKPLNGWTHCLVDQFLCQTLHQISRLIPIAFQCTILCMWIFCTSTNQASGQCHIGSSPTVFVAQHRHFKWVSASGMYCKQGDSIGMHKYCKYCGTGTHFAGLHPDALGKAAQTMQGPRQEPDVWPDFAVGLLFLFWAHRKVWWPRTVK